MVFAVAMATEIALGRNLTKQVFQQKYKKVTFCELLEPKPFYLIPMTYAIILRHIPLYIIQLILTVPVI